VALTLFQYYVQGYYGDHNGGIFAPVQACNKYSNVFCSVLLIWVMIQYLKGNVKIQKVVLTCICAVIVAIYAELKFLFIEMIIIIALVVIVCGRSNKTVRGVLIGGIVAYVGLYTLSALFPSSFQFLTDSDLFIWYARDMSYSNTAVSVNRLSGFDIINKYIFGNSVARKVFGYGLGATGQISLLHLYSNILTEYYSLYYQTFTYSWIYVELGIAGIVFFYSSILSSLIPLSKACKKMMDSNGLIAISKTAVVMTLILTIYDSSWMTEGPTFLCAFAMAVGFVTIKEHFNCKGKTETI
jgi:hypothetical protein